MSGSDHSSNIENNSVNSKSMHSVRGMEMLQHGTRSNLQPNVLPQPNTARQPHNLQDVLRYSIAATTENNASAISPMDSERRAFLEATLRTFTRSAVDTMTACIEVLLSPETVHDVSFREEALEHIIDLVDNLDNANDFFKIGGFQVIDSGLCSPHASLRASTATLLAELSQNNNFIQDHVLETNFLALLLNMVDTDSVPNVRVKAFYAISCIVRDHELGLREFSTLNGLTVLLRALQSSIEKLQLKASFLLSSLCVQNPEIINQLCDLGYVEQLCGLLTKVSQYPLVEHVLQALLSMVKNNKKALELCTLPKLQLESTLKNMLMTTDKDVDDFQYAQQLLNLVFKH